MLTDVGGHEGIATGHFPELFDDELRLDDISRGAIVLEAILGSPLGNLGPPGRDAFVHFGTGIDRRAELGEHLGQALPNVADNRHIDLDPL